MATLSLGNIQVRFSLDASGQWLSSFPCREAAKRGVLAEQSVEVVAPRARQAENKDGRIDRLVMDLRVSLDQVVQSESGTQQAPDILTEAIAPEGVIIIGRIRRGQKILQGGVESFVAKVREPRALRYALLQVLCREWEELLCPRAKASIGDPHRKA